MINGFTKRVLIIIWVGLLISCGGDKDTSTPPSTATKINAINIIGALELGLPTTAEVVCESCLLNEASFIWTIDGEVVSSSNTFTPNEQTYGKKVKVTATVLSVSGIISNPKIAIMKRRIVVKALSIFGLDVFLMSDGEIVSRSNHYEPNWPLPSDKKFVDIMISSRVWGNILAKDEEGNYYEFGENPSYNNFDDIKDKLQDVTEYWIDSTGHHALNANNTLLSWGSYYGDYDFDFITHQPELENVKQIVPSIVDSGYGIAGYATLFNNGDLIIDAFAESDRSYQRLTRKNIKKIQGIGIGYKVDPYGKAEHLAITDYDDNVEIWTYRDVNSLSGDLQGIDKIISPFDSTNFLAFKKDGSFVVGNMRYDPDLLDIYAPITGLIRIDRVWGLLGINGDFISLFDEPPFDEDLLSLFPLTDLSYNVGDLVVKTTGEGFLVKDIFFGKEPVSISNIDNAHYASGYYFITSNGTLNIYGKNETQLDWFSNGLGYSNNVDRFFPLMSGALTLDIDDIPTLVDLTYGFEPLSSFIEKLNPGLTILYFGKEI